MVANSWRLRMSERADCKCRLRSEQCVDCRRARRASVIGECFEQHKHPKTNHIKFRALDRLRQFAVFMPLAIAGVRLRVLD